MVSQEKMNEQARVAAGTYMSSVELVSAVVRDLSGRDLSGESPTGDMHDNFGREIIAAKINAEIEGRTGGTK